MSASESGLRMRAFQEVYMDSVSIYLRDGTKAGRSIIMEDVDPGMLQEPLIRLTTQAAQELINDLWSAGLRPSEAKNTRDEVNAIKAHLEDMRQITFDKLKVDKP